MFSGHLMCFIIIEHGTHLLHTDINTVSWKCFNYFFVPNVQTETWNFVPCGYELHIIISFRNSLVVSFSSYWTYSENVLSTAILLHVTRLPTSCHFKSMNRFFSSGEFTVDCLLIWWNGQLLQVLFNMNLTCNGLYIFTNKFWRL